MDRDNLNLTDFINKETLQTMQDAFTNLSGMASVITDPEGEPITRESGFCDFCKNYTRATDKGRKLCSQCYKIGTQTSLTENASITYPCHAGLTYFSAPIMIDGIIVACFVGGQVLTQPPDEKKIKETAKELGIDPDEYYEAAKKINVIPKEKIDRSAKFLFTVSDSLSDIAYGKYTAIKANEELELASQLKSNFLANMSHEIRTPMNAVIGMAELALRENIPIEARNYINQIKSSGRALLTLINDILDFSKIESGKLELQEESYESISLFHDVTNIIMTRIQDKDIELILNINPNLPELLNGDANRIRQILINLLNNATKFTHKGQIRLSVDFDNITTESIMLKVCVEDTGIGIKESDIGKLFKSFEQVDSKRNRNIEGTGLGLAISKRLVDLMGGEIYVKSKYNEGSRFYFSIPQDIQSDKSSVIIKDTNVAVVAIIHTPYLITQMKKDLSRLKLSSVFLPDNENLKQRIRKLKEEAGDKKIFIFIEEYFICKAFIECLQTSPDIQGILVSGFFSDISENKNLKIQNLLIIKKPWSVLSLATILNRELGDSDDSPEQEGSSFSFTAPDADILIVDDNPINLTVAEGLLEPLKMKIDTATSGAIALNRIKSKRYDIIFMDHMMPEMDGIECTRVIRSNYPDYANVPIIALTANAVGNVKAMFIKEGMDDFVAKPIEVKTLISKVKQWLPKDKIIASNDEVLEMEEIDYPEIADLNVEQAVSRLGSFDLFNKILLEFYRTISKKCEAIENCIKEKDYKSYTIEVHALKSSAKQIGANSLSEMAADLERYGKEMDVPFILAKTPEAFEKYKSYTELLKDYCEKDNEEDKLPKTQASMEEKKEALDSIKEAADNLDLDSIEGLIKKIKGWELGEEEKAIFDKLSEAAENMDCDSCIQVCDQWKSYWQEKNLI
ncbi:PocR ligand-binding domain-containing protein [Treponema sp.]|uniref:PocR ligand-binding domain-containing protein n=1 Tax=Treponema sp. TaxID=166 RepID=UPI0025D7E687|nr:PocR ligand-binding domain-containing protein [Treponema sp.]MCR5218199.1 PocR ligand-binding domain-containing protein [Treponema sp.]